jgi:hypothetical protein
MSLQVVCDELATGKQYGSSCQLAICIDPGPKIPSIEHAGTVC